MTADRTPLDGHLTSLLAYLARVGVSQADVSKKQALLKLPAKVLSKLDSGGITLTEAYEITRLAEHPDRIGKVFTRHSYQSVKQAVDDQLRDLHAEAKRAAARKELADAGTRYVEWPNQGRSSWDGRKERPLKGQKNAWLGFDVVDLTVRQHEGERQCHAGTIDQHGKIFYICTNPSQHAAKGKSKGKPAVDEKEKKARSLKRAHNKDLREAHAARAEFIVKLLGKRVAQKDLAELYLVVAVVDRHIERIHHGHELACTLLEAKVKRGSYGEDHTKTLQELIEGPDEAKVGLAIGIALFEHNLLGKYAVWKAPSVAMYVRFLEARGYEVSPAERRELDGKAPR